MLFRATVTCLATTSLLAASPISAAARVALGGLASLALAWLVFVVALAVFRPRGIGLSEAKRLVPDLVRLLRDLAADPSTSRSVRRRLGLLLGYLALPIDLIPDFIPILGWADDVIIVALVLRSVVRRAGPQALDRHWHGADVGLELVHRLAGISAPTRATPDVDAAPAPPD